MTNAMNVATTIHQQLFAMDRNLMWALGFNSPLALVNAKNQPSLSFKVKGVKHKGHVRISLDEGLDLYDISIFTARKVPNKDETSITVKYEATGLYVDDLPGILEEYCY